MTAEPDYWGRESQPQLQQQSNEPDYWGKEATKQQPRSFFDTADIDELDKPPTFKEFGEGIKGLLSGATFGGTTNIPGMKPEDNWATTATETIGATLPYGYLFKALGPLINIGKNIPYIGKGVNSLMRVIGAAGVGTVGQSTEKILKEHELPTEKELIHYAAEWGAMDAAFQFLGIGGKFAKELLRKTESSGKSAYELSKEVVDQLKSKNVNFKDPKAIGDAVFPILEEIGQEAKKPPIQVLKRTEIEPPVGGASGMTPPAISKAEMIEASQKPISTAKPVHEKLREPGITPQDLTKKKIKPQFFDNIEYTFEEPSKPITAKDIEADISKPIAQEELDQFAKRSATTKELGESTKKDIEQTLDAAKKEYTPLYDTAKEGTENIKVKTAPIGTIATQALERLESIKTKPAGYAATIKTIEDVLHDAGFAIHEDKGRRLIIPVKPEGVPGNKLIELSKRLGEIAEFESIEPSVKDALKPLRKEAKKLVLQELERSNPKAHQALVEADRKFAETTKKYGKDVVTGVRTTQLPENISGAITKASNLENLKAVMTPQQYKQIEREILQNLNDSSYVKARQAFRELAPQLSPEAKQLGERIVQDKAPKFINQTKKLEGWISDQIAKPGKPTQLVNYWKTKPGRQAIRHALRNNPNKDNIIKYLQKNELAEMASKIVDSKGNIDLKAFDKLVSSESGLATIRDIGGQDAVDFFKNLKTYQNRMETLASNFEKLQEIGKEVIPTTPSKPGKPGTVKKFPEAQAKLERTAEANQKKALQDVERKARMAERFKQPELGQQAQRAEDLKTIAEGKDKSKVAKEKVEKAKERIEKDKSRGKEKIDELKQKIRKLKYPEVVTIENHVKGLDNSTKTLLGLIGFFKFGWFKTGVAIAGKKQVGQWAVQLAENPRLRHLVKEVANGRANKPYELYLSVQLLDQYTKDQKD